MSVPVKLLLNQVGSYLQPIALREVSVAAQRVRYLESGRAESESLVFLHGLAGSKAQWRSMMGAFASQFRVIAPDVPGLCLRAPLPGARHTLKQLMSWLDAFLQAVGLERVHLVAHSTACPLAAVYAGDRQSVGSLALISFPDVLAPSFSGQGQAYEKYKREIDFQTMEEWDAFFRRAFFSPVKVPTAIKRYNFRKFKQYGDNFISVVDDLTKHQSMVMPYLKRVDSKALVINGDHDNFADSRFHDMLEAHLPGAQHVTLERCGHMAFIDRFADVLSLLEDFFSPASGERRDVAGR